jgi:hypothetical protein
VPLQELWRPIASRLQSLLSLRVESQVRLFASARVSSPAQPPAPPSPPHQPPIAATDDPVSSKDALPPVLPSPLEPTVPRTLIPEADLPFFVDLDAWSLGHGRTGSGHMHPLAEHAHLIPENLLHFVGYAPAKWRHPMAIAGEPASTGFVIPGWGAVAILNVEQAALGGVLPPESEAAFFGLVLQQFRTLLGLPGGWPLMQHGTISAVPAGDQLLTLWELDSLVRQRYVQLLEETARTTVTLLDLVR